MSSHQRCWLWGRHLVLETLQAGRWPVIEAQISEDLAREERGHAERLARERGAVVTVASSRRLAQLCGARDHQGFLAKVRPFPYTPLKQLLNGDAAPTALLLLDRIQDAYNFGAVIRAAEVFGFDGLIVGTHAQAEVNSLAARSSAGAVNYLPIAQTSDLPAALAELRRRGFRGLAAEARATESIDQQDLTNPTVVILGNEHSGIDGTLLQACDASVCIPQHGRTESLNIAVAAGILCYEVCRQRTRTTAVV